MLSIDIGCAYSHLIELWTADSTRSRTAILAPAMKALLRLARTTISLATPSPLVTRMVSGAARLGSLLRRDLLSDSAAAQACQESARKQQS